MIRGSASYEQVNTFALGDYAVEGPEPVLQFLQDQVSASMVLYTQ